MYTISIYVYLCDYFGMPILAYSILYYFEKLRFKYLKEMIIIVKYFAYKTARSVFYLPFILVRLFINDHFSVCLMLSSWQKIRNPYNIHCLFYCWFWINYRGFLQCSFCSYWVISQHIGIKSVEISSATWCHSHMFTNLTGVLFLFCIAFYFLIYKYTLHQ